MAHRFVMKSITALLALLGIIVSAVPEAAALDAARDRRGVFWGMGVNGGGVFAVPAGGAGGDVEIDLQLGAGASRHLTLAFDIDLGVMVVDAFGGTALTISPGPEVVYFFRDTGVFLGGGAAGALAVVFLDDDSDFRGGFEVSVAFGWEFFANTNLALGLGLESRYVVLTGDDLVGVCFAFGFKYY